MATRRLEAESSGGRSLLVADATGGGGRMKRGQGGGLLEAATAGAKAEGALAIVGGGLVGDEEGLA
nr:unnamed protein product [Digitaria exilis]